jgi:hypothetical protein
LAEGTLEDRVDSVLSKQIDDLEPALTRHGYGVELLTELLGTKFQDEGVEVMMTPRLPGRQLCSHPASIVEISPGGG